MSPPRRRGKQQRGGRPDPSRAVDLWRPVPAMAEPEPIRPASDPTAMVRSLGSPPLPGQREAAERRFAAVLLKASQVATALAAAGDLLADAGNDDED